jgi:hypothetical protein
MNIVRKRIGRKPFGKRVMISANEKNLYSMILKPLKFNGESPLACHRFVFAIENITRDDKEVDLIFDAKVYNPHKALHSCFLLFQGMLRIAV